MTFNDPSPFREALQSRAVKKLMPTPLSSAELMRLEASVRERAMFSARVMNEEFLQRARNLIDGLLNPARVTRPDGSRATEGVDPASARLELKQFLRSINYQPEPDQAGTIQDLRTDARLNLILRTNVEMAQGYGRWAQGQDEALLDAWPAQELVRVIDRAQKRNWYARWRAAGGKIFPGQPEGLALVEGMEGRCIALKNDPVWEALSAFGQPYPPFDFNSGVDVADVARAEAIDLGLIDLETRIEPQTRGFEMDLSA